MTPVTFDSFEDTYLTFLIGGISFFTCIARYRAFLSTAYGSSFCGPFLYLLYLLLNVEVRKGILEVWLFTDMGNFMRTHKRKQNGGLFGTRIGLESTV